MATRQPTKHTSNRDTTPEEPQVVPMTSSYGMPGHDFTLQAVMELQKSVGKLEATLSSLSDQVKDQSGKVDRIGDKVSGMSHKIYAAGVVLTILVVIGGWLVNKSWDLVQKIAEPAIKTALVQSDNATASASPANSDTTK